MHACRLVPVMPYGVAGSPCAPKTRVRTRFRLTRGVLVFWLVCLASGFVTGMCLDGMFTPQQEWTCQGFCFPEDMQLNGYQVVDRSIPGPDTVHHFDLEDLQLPTPAK